MLVFTKYLQFQSCFLHFLKNTTAIWLKNKQKQLPKKKTLLLTLPFVSHQTWLGHTEEGCHHSEKDRERYVHKGAHESTRNRSCCCWEPDTRYLGTSKAPQHSTHQDKMMGFCLRDCIQDLLFFNTCYFPHVSH